MTQLHDCCLYDCNLQQDATITVGVHLQENHSYVNQPEGKNPDVSGLGGSLKTEPAEVDEIFKSQRRRRLHAAARSSRWDCCRCDKMCQVHVLLMFSSAAAFTDS